MKLFDFFNKEKKDKKDNKENKENKCLTCYCYNGVTKKCERTTLFCIKR